MHEQEIKQFGDRCEIFRPLKPVIAALLWAVLAMMVAPLILKVQL